LGDGGNDGGAGPTYRFGDLLAAARAVWLRRMAALLEEHGYRDYRRSDAILLRQLRGRSVPLGTIGTYLGISRQAARKLVDGLEARGYACSTRDAADARVVRVALTGAGEGYADAVAQVIDSLNRQVAGRVPGLDLRAADAVLRAVIEGDEVYAAIARRIPAP